MCVFGVFEPLVSPLMLFRPQKHIKSLSYLCFLSRLAGSPTDHKHTLIKHKHTLSHCSMFHLEQMTNIIRLQTHGIGQNTSGFCEMRWVSLLVSTAKIPREDCQEKWSVLLVVRDGPKLYVSTQSIQSDGVYGGHCEDFLVLTHYRMHLYTLAMSKCSYNALLHTFTHTLLLNNCNGKRSVRALPIG